MERLTIPDVRVDEHTTRRSVIDLTCKKLEYRKNYVYPYRCLLNKAERFSEDECLRRVMEVYKCDKYEEADLDDYCSRGEKKGVTE